MKHNSRHFTFAYPLNVGRENKGELTISGKCWQCASGDQDGYASEPYGFDIDKVTYTEQYGLNGKDVTGLYEYLLQMTTDGANNFENAAIAHIAGLYETETLTNKAA